MSLWVSLAEDSFPLLLCYYSVGDPWKVVERPRPVQKTMLPAAEMVFSPIEPLRCKFEVTQGAGSFSNFLPEMNPLKKNVGTSNHMKARGVQSILQNQTL